LCIETVLKRKITGPKNRRMDNKEYSQDIMVKETNSLIWIWLVMGVSLIMMKRIIYYLTDNMMNFLNDCLKLFKIILNLKLKIILQ
jgi:hypothetical protein